MTNVNWMRAQWRAPMRVHAGTTLRSGGVSRAGYASLNLAAHVGDEAAAVAENRALLRAALQLPAEPCWLDQVHGCAVAQAEGCAAGWAPQADAAVAHATGVVCAVLTADCLPVVFCDRGGSRVAVAHGGWRGLAGGVLEATVAALAVEPQSLLAWLGPAIGQAHFEVGDEVRQAFCDPHPQAQRAFVISPKGRWLADLYELARIRLAACGVESVYGGGLCVFRDAERFYSFRRDGQCSGRMATLAWIVDDNAEDGS
jgi:YfiH family protein